jgi:hypothetical protein
MNITILEKPGRCRLCGCTYTRPCASGCAWANRRQTLCSACVKTDRLLRSADGRAELVTLVNDAEAPYGLRRRA